jgi:hypothetical protein
MPQIAANPWSFTNADQAATVAITSIVNNGATALVTTSAVHGFTGNEQISIQGTTTATGWRGGYRVLAVPSTTTFYIVIPSYKHLLVNNGANGNVLTAAYLDIVRAEQILWDSPAADATLLLTDVNGNVVWNPTSSTVDPGAGSYTYGKTYFIRGLVINTLPSGTVQVTVN